MRPCFAVEIVTPKKILLNGLWFGPRKPENAIILVHGLTGSVFSMSGAVDALTNSSTAVLAFNNRGFGHINSVKRLRGKKAEYVTAGTAHEVFTECVDDIQGAVNAAKKNGARNIYLAGHSTGSQKVVYWASKKKDPRVKGLILFGPLSDYSGALKSKGRGVIEQGVSFARKLIAAGKPHALMPEHLREWFECDAQRFLSLYTPESAEEIFTYARPKQKPITLLKIRLPVLVFLAGADEYGDRPPREIAAWFDKHLKTKHAIVIVRKAPHGFRGAKREIAAAMKKFMKS